MVDGIVIDPLRRAKRLAAVCAAGEHHVGPVAGAGRQHTGDHIDVVVCRTAGTVHCDKRLPTESYSIYPALKKVATHVNLSDSVKGRCLASVLRVARTLAIKGATFSGEKKIAIRVDVHRSGLGRVGNINRTHPGGSAVRGTVEFPKITSEEARPKLVHESVTHAPNIRIDGKPLLVTPMPRFVGRLLRERLAAVG